MDEYIATPSELRGPSHANKMAPASPSSESTGESLPSSEQAEALTLIRAELTQRMLTKADTGTLVREMRAAWREELAGLRKDLNALEQRVEEVEMVAHGCEQQHRAAEVAATRQGNMLLTLRRQVEDLENRSRRNNIRGLPETETEP
ncbi:Hypothetical predicted protein [Pelobates cultripes]|uniref:Uncharacterized protein n=1 Tax=Pelobates cultripes TaxID=61616 RepID=A0AAD1R497_PELCU|nr:Hypothetical predicted protein [Pelobates cultripes]